MFSRKRISEWPRQTSRFKVAAVKLLPALLCVLCAPLIARAQLSGVGPKLPPPPESRIYDPGHVLDRNPAAYAEISAALKQLAEKYHYQVYLHVESVFLSESPQQVAEEARQAWVAGNDGLTIAYEADTRRVGFGQDISRSLEIEPHPVSVPLHESSAIINAALKNAAQNAAPEKHLVSLVTGLAKGYTAYFQNLTVSQRPGQTRRQVLLLTGALCVVALGVLLYLMLRRRQGISTDRMEFPAADVSERLGAPCGAQVVSRSFRKTSYGH